MQTILFRTRSFPIQFWYDNNVVKFTSMNHLHVAMLFDICRLMKIKIQLITIKQASKLNNHIVYERLIN